MNTTQVAVDLAKSVFQVAVSRSPGRIDEQHRLSRGRFQHFFAKYHTPGWTCSALSMGQLSRRKTVARGRWTAFMAVSSGTVYVARRRRAGPCL